MHAKMPNCFDSELKSGALKMREDNKNPIQVIDRLVSLLDVLSHHSDPISLNVLAADAGLHPSTAHRILGSMVQAGFVERGEGGMYRLGIRLLELGSLVKARLSIREVALPVMLQLHAQTQESVNLGIRDGDHIVYIERTTSGRSAVRIVHILGSRAPLHTSASGKLFLAQDSPEQVAAYAQQTGLPPSTAASITSLSALEKELEEVRKTGVAFDIDEVEAGVRCIAAGIYDDTGALVAGLSLSSPSERFVLERTTLVQETAQIISKSLGYKG
jgi:DNA-binding IclR family transcriptional regulator